MSTVTESTASTGPAGPTSTEPAVQATGLTPAPVNTMRVFLALLRRDVFVTGREIGTFLAQVLIQPLFMLFVFGKVLTELGYANQGLAHLLLPGIVALTSFLTALQATALPLVLEFSFTKEIEDRLLAPIPTHLVAIEKITFAALRALLAGAVVFPLGVLVLGGANWQASGIALLVVILLLGALVGAAFGLVVGTSVPPAKISVMFAVILTPLFFTGATQYPWPSLDALPWFKWITVVNPLTYVSEGMRAAVVPDVPHMHPLVCVLALLGFLVVFTAFGVRGFMRRALD